MVRMKHLANKLMLAILIICLLASTIHLFVPKVKSVTWLEGYTYRKTHKIIGSSGAGANYQIMFKVKRSSGTDSGNTVYVSTHCKEDFSDIRFADANANVFPYAIVYQTTDEAWFWVKCTTLDLSINQTIYMYYGNSEATSESNPDATFIFYEKWDSATLNTSKWTWVAATDGTYSIDTVNHWIKITATAHSPKPYIKNATSVSFPSSWIMEDYYGENQGFTVDWYITNSITYGYSYWASFGFGTGVPSPTTSAAFVEARYLSGTYNKNYRCGVASNEDWTSSQNYDDRNNKILNLWKMAKVGDTWKLYWNGTLVHSETDTSAISVISFRTYCGEYRHGIFGAFKIRKFTDPEPSHGEWSEETTFIPILYVGSNVATYFKLDGTTHSTPYSTQVDLGSDHDLQALYSTIMLNASHYYGFSHWEKDGAWFSDAMTIDTGAINQDVNFTMVYTNIRFNVTSDGIEGVAVSVSGSTLYTPFFAYRGEGATNFEILTLSKSYNETHSYYYVGAYVNGSWYSGSATFSITAYGDTDVFLDYELVYTPPEPPPVVVPSESSIVTWYFRNDLHTVEEQLGYKLSEDNSLSTESYTEDVDANLSITIGFRAWVYTRFGRTEITPSVVAQYVITSNGEHEVNSTWYYTGSNEIVDAVEIRIYIKFGAGSWVQMLVGITDDDLYIRLPEGSWQMVYNIERNGNSTYTNATLRWGSPSYDTRVILPTAAASPWDVALIKLVNFDVSGFALTPFTYHLGDLFYAIMLLFCIVTAYNEKGSLGYILAILWLFGGVGSILSMLLPALTLNIAYILLAFATAFTLLKFLIK